MGSSAWSSWLPLKVCNGLLQNQPAAHQPGSQPSYARARSLSEHDALRPASRRRSSPGAHDRVRPTSARMSGKRHSRWGREAGGMSNDVQAAGLAVPASLAADARTSSRYSTPKGGTGPPQPVSSKHGDGSLSRTRHSRSPHRRTEVKQAHVPHPNDRMERHASDRHSRHLEPAHKQQGRSIRPSEASHEGHGRRYADVTANQAVSDRPQSQQASRGRDSRGARSPLDEPRHASGSRAPPRKDSGSFDSSSSSSSLSSSGSDTSRGRYRSSSSSSSSSSSGSSSSSRSSYSDEGEIVHAGKPTSYANVASRERASSSVPAAAAKAGSRGSPPHGSAVAQEDTALTSEPNPRATQPVQEGISAQDLIVPAPPRRRPAPASVSAEGSSHERTGHAEMVAAGKLDFIWCSDNGPGLHHGTSNIIIKASWPLACVHAHYAPIIKEHQECSPLPLA